MRIYEPFGLPNLPRDDVPENANSTESHEGFVQLVMGKVIGEEIDFMETKGDE
jgi:hypothetical protein